MPSSGPPRHNPPIEQTIRLFHRRWSVPVIANLLRSGPLGFVGLLALLGASRDTLSKTLASLIGSGLVAHGPGDGRRAVYYLTPAGKAVATECVACVEAVRRLGLARTALKKWPMIVLVAVGRGQARYNALKADLPGISPRALAAALKDLEHAGLVTRTIQERYPPTTSYHLTALGEQLLPPMENLVRACERLPIR